MNEENEQDFTAPHPGQQVQSDLQAPFGNRPLEAEEETEEEGIFPPDIQPAVEIGGTPEERSELREEYRERDRGNR